MNSNVIEVDFQEKANINDPQVWEAVKKAAAVLDGQNIAYVLMGTAGLAGHGIRPRAVPDVDFMVERAPLPPADFEPHYGGNGSKDTGTYMVPVKGDAVVVKVDFVLAQTPVEKGFLQETSVEIDGIKTMTVDNLLAIKRWKGRPKDFEFLKLLDGGGEPAVDIF